MRFQSTPMQLNRFLLGVASGVTVGYAARRCYEAALIVNAPADPTGGDAHAYGRANRALALSSTLRSMFGVVALAYGPLGEAADRVTDRIPITLRPAAFAGALGLLEALADLPIAFVEDYARERRYALTEQTPRMWAIDYAKGAALGVGLTSIFAILMGAIMRRMPRSWPIVASLGTLPLLLLANLIVPLYVLPLFNRFEPLTGALEVRLRALAARYGVGDAEILRMDMSRQTKKANAFVVGMGRTHRIVLGDTLIEHFTPEEIEFVVAHELGHYVMRDTWRMTAVGQALATTLFIGAHFAVDGRDSASLRDRPLLLARTYAAMAIGTQVLRPLMLAFSRSREWAADRFALDATRDPRSGAAAFRRLRDQNLAEDRVPQWYELLFSSHPSLGQRIASLEHNTSGKLRAGF